MKKFLWIILAFFLVACDSSGPQSTLNNMANALDENNPEKFLACFDLTVYANNELNSYTESDAALNAINSFGRMFGLGSVDDLLSSIIDMKGNIQERFIRGIASGELMAQCRVAITPDCPWVPLSLRSASIVQIDNDAAIAKVTTPAKLTSWVCLRKINNKWLVVGQAVLEAKARELAMAPVKPAPALPSHKQSGSQHALDI